MLNFIIKYFMVVSEGYTFYWKSLDLIFSRKNTTPLNRKPTITTTKPDETSSISICSWTASNSFSLKQVRAFSCPWICRCRLRIPRSNIWIILEIPKFKFGDYVIRELIKFSALCLCDSTFGNAYFKLNISLNGEPFLRTIAVLALPLNPETTESSSQRNLWE